LISTGTEYGPIVGFCEYGNEQFELLTSIWCWGQRMYEAIPHSPSTPSWCGA